MKNGRSLPKPGKVSIFLWGSCEGNRQMNQPTKIVPHKEVGIKLCESVLSRIQTFSSLQSDKAGAQDSVRQTLSQEMRN